MTDDELSFSLMKYMFINLTIIIFIIFSTSKYVYAINLGHNKISSDNVVNIYVDAYKVSVNGIAVGYVSKSDEEKKILAIIENRLIKKLGLKREDINNISIKTDISYENKSVNLVDVNTYEEIVDNIEFLNANTENTIVKSNVNATNKAILDIEPSVKIINTEELYLWESKVNKGYEGKKEIVKTDNFINGVLENRNIISEEVLLKPKETIIYKGTKDPILSGNAFLLPPTRGGDVTSNFGRRKSGNHNGIDIGVELGTPIGAACDGIVSYIGWDDIYGNMVIIKHSNSIETVYAHASEILTKTGKKVQRGETIAKVGSTGRSTGPHLHFELRYNGNAINPNNFIY
ncbi:MAG: peptidoglycan DD-metalloendopeptidase family protein [Sarcina sp.]